MDLLGDVERERQGGDFDWGDIGESQQVGPVQPVELDAARRVEADVEEELIEHPAGQLRPHVVANGGSLRQLIESGRSLDCEDEAIAEVGRLSQQQVVGRRGLVAGSREIDVLRRPRAIAKAVVERQGAL